MKDLNCYARFLEYPGVEKLRTVDQNKASFLAPVTSHRAGHCSFLCSAYTTVWPVSNFGCSHTGPTASRPLLFCIQTIHRDADCEGVFQCEACSFSTCSPLVFFWHRFFLGLAYLSWRLRPFAFVLAKYQRLGQPLYTLRLRPFAYGGSTPERSGQPFWKSRLGPLSIAGRTGMLAGQPLFFALILCLVFLLMICGCSQAPSATLHPPGTWAGFTVAPDIPIDVRQEIGPVKPADFHFWNETYHLNLAARPAGGD